MSSLTIKEIFNLEDNEAIPKTSLKVDKMFPPQDHGKGQYKKRKINAYAVDETHDGKKRKMYLCFVGDDEYIQSIEEMEIEGKWVDIACSKGKQGATGVKKKVEGEGDEYHKIWVTPSANINVAGGDSGKSSKITSTKSSGGSSAPPSSGDRMNLSKSEYVDLLSSVYSMSIENCGIEDEKKAHDFALKSIEVLPLYWFGDVPVTKITKGASTQSTESEDDEDEETPAKASKEKTDWTKLKHPKTGESLGSLEPEQVTSLIAYALGSSKKDEFLDALRNEAVESYYGGDLQKAAIAHINCILEKNSIEADATKILADVLDPVDLEEADNDDILEHFKGINSDLKAFRIKVKKLAKKYPLTSGDDEDDDEDIPY